MSTYTLLGIPDGVAGTLATVCLVLMLAPYAAGADFGFLTVPTFTAIGKRRLQIIGPVLVICALASFIQAWPKAKEAMPTPTPIIVNVSSPVNAMIALPSATKEKPAEPQSTRGIAVVEPSPRTSTSHGFPFTLTSETSEFAIVASFEGRYAVDGVFLTVDVDRLTFTLRELGAGHYNGKRQVHSLSFCIVRKLPDGGWSPERCGPSLPINMVMSPGETKTLPSLHTIIPIAGVNELRMHWIMATFLASDAVGERTGTAHVHSLKYLLSGAPTGR
jgi:hypothetical protein